LTDAAHGESFGHQVFHKSLKVDIKLEKVNTPDSYLKTLPDGITLGRKMKIWYVQKARTRIEGAVCRVRDPGSTPDLETIMLGFAPGKPYEASAICRHGNFLQWGYASAPSQMMPAGRNLFVNCITYVHKFDGKRPEFDR
jgi:hypothetical protein